DQRLLALEDILHRVFECNDPALARFIPARIMIGENDTAGCSFWGPLNDA
ncbi:MAG: hypothetical protein ACI9A1_001134, partial [Lentimonas sp.]